MPNYSIPTPIFHSTHAANFASLLAAGGILCRNKIDATYKSCAFESVQAQRENFCVPVSRGGTIHDYVPFYFNSRSPMLYTIKCGNVANVKMQDLIFLQSSVQIVADSGNEYAFTDGHGIMVLSEYYDDLIDLDKLPWNVIKAKYWNDFPDGKRLRQAEFLVYERFRWSLIKSIGVYDERMQLQLIKQISELEHIPNVEIRREWYF